MRDFHLAARAGCLARSFCIVASRASKCGGADPGRRIRYRQCPGYEAKSGSDSTPPARACRFIRKISSAARSHPSRLGKMTKTAVPDDAIILLSDRCRSRGGRGPPWPVSEVYAGIHVAADDHQQTGSALTIVSASTVVLPVSTTSGLPSRLFPCTPTWRTPSSGPRAASRASCTITYASPPRPSIHHASR